MTDVEIVVFNDKSWVRFTEYQKVKEENEQLKAQIEKMKCCYLCKKVYDCAFADVFNFHCCDKWELAE